MTEERLKALHETLVEERLKTLHETLVIVKHALKFC